MDFSKIGMTKTLDSLLIVMASWRMVKGQKRKGHVRAEKIKGRGMQRCHFGFTDACWSSNVRSCWPKRQFSWAPTHWKRCWAHILPTPMLASFFYGEGPLQITPLPPHSSLSDKYLKERILNKIIWLSNNN